MKRPKKKARTKEVPADYVCRACNNEIKPLHWIYDCPNKLYKPGTNKVKKGLRGINDPDSRKVFISGLPFDAKTKEVEMYFEKEMKCGKVVHCKLLQFEDTKRCKGSGFLTFETDEGAQKALKLNGKVLSLPTKDEDGKKKSSKKQTKQQKELRLGVKKLLNRTITKNRSKYSTPRLIY
jgi:RNA recognition motif-containing protein